MSPEITSDQIAEVVDKQSDFDLELFVYRALRERGIEASHAGTYKDIVTEKRRQFDVRATLHCGPGCVLSLALEWKSVSVDFPVLVYCVRHVPRICTKVSSTRRQLPAGHRRASQRLSNSGTKRRSQRQIVDG